MNHDGPQIYIEQDAICGEYIQPLPVDYSQVREGGREGGGERGREGGAGES